MVTLREIAAAAGVSIATVSKALNDIPNVAPDTRQKVWKIASELGYKKTAYLRNEAGDARPVIGLIIPSLEHPLLASIAHHVETRASRHGYFVIPCSTDRDPGREASHLTELQRQEADGIIIFAASEQCGATIRQIGYPPEKVVALDHPIQGLAVHAVLSDNAKGTEEACEHLIGLGHQRIALITGPASRWCNAERLKAFVEVLQRHGIPIDQALIKESTFGVEGGYHFAWEMLQYEDPPTAIFAFNDLMAFGVMSALGEKGLRVPQDVSVVGFDDIPIAGYYHPRLTTVRQAYQDMSAIAVDHIVECNHPQTAGVAGGRGHATLATRLIIRETTARCPALSLAQVGQV